MKISPAIAALVAAAILLIQTGHIAAADLPSAMIEAPVPSSQEATIPPPQEERGIWAAIAYSEIDRKHGFFWGADKRQEAMDIAFEHCVNAGGEACKVVEVFRNHRHWNDDDQTGFPYYPCGALAISEEQPGQITPWGARSAPTRREAEDQALRACKAGEGKCEIREWVCT
ncbi:DUF4189 domain-containing protein [Chelativorans sp. YIM 93263]|uniref:DUF4189 domain-containing protein n=1 Tax=Chelativorans sp. YIM 93263 TaxID=2906648 RepID=UPI002379CFE4|nr:DUF4189 domain-containing protein [Chelativorans sp. YIM 93263]